jgi:spore coat polysaccharide biosynthesis protein SpsF
MKVVAVTQARSGSTRLPGKIFKEILGKSLLQIHLERLKKSKQINTIVVATTTNPEDLNVCNLAEKLRVECFRGSENNVLDRFYQAVKNQAPDYVVRVTSDCPLLDPELIDSVVELAITNGVDYCSNVLKETFPDGQDVEVFTFQALEKSWHEAALLSDQEHVTPYIRNNSDFNQGKLFRAASYESQTSYGQIRMTVDQQEDFDVIKYLVENLGTDKTWKQYVDFMLTEKDVLSMNKHINRNEGYTKSLKKEDQKQ